MKQLLIYIIFFLLCSNVIAQTPRPTGSPTQFSTGWFRQGYQQSDSATIIATRDTSWTPRFPGTVVLWQNPGVDTVYWYHNGSKWGKVSGTGGISSVAWGDITGTLSNQTDLQNALNLKLNIADTATMLGPYLNATGFGLFRNSQFIRADTTRQTGLPSYFYVDSIAGTAGTSNANVGAGYRWLIPSTQQIKTMSPGYGFLLDSTTTANTLTGKIDTTVIVSKSASKWPAEAPLGQIYNENNWTDLNDFDVNTAGGATTALALSTGYVNYTVSTIDWDNYTTIMPYRPTILPKWRMVMRFRMNTTPAATTTGFGFGLKRFITQNNDVLCYINTTSGGSSGQIRIERGDGSDTYATASSTAVSVNDVIELTLTFTDSTLTFTSQNITDGAGVSSVTFPFPIASSLEPIPTICNFALIGHSGVSCTWQIQSLNISSLTTRNGNLYGLGDSKTQGYDATSYAGRYITQLNANYPSTVVYAGGGGTIADFLNLREEIAELNGIQWLFSIGSNDKRAAVTDAIMIERYQRLTALVQAGGATVYHIVIPEDSTAGGVGLTAFKNYVSTLPNYIDVWTTMSTSNVLKAEYNAGDGIHINQAGNNVIDSIILAAGVIRTAPTNRFAPYRVTDNTIFTLGDSIYTYPTQRRPGFVNHWDVNGSSVAGVIQDNGSQMLVSAPGTEGTPITNMITTFTGQVAINGTGGGILFANRTGNQSAGLFSIYSTAAQLRFFNVTGGRDLHLMDSTGRFNVGNNTTPTAWLQIRPGEAAVSRAPLKFISGTNLTSPEAGAVEYNGTSLFFTPASTRLRAVLTDNTIPSNGQIPIGNGVNYTNALVTGSGGIVITNGAGTINVGTTGLATGNTLYTGDGTLAGLRTVTLSTNNLVFDATSTGKPIFNLGSDANGDMYYRSSGVLTRFAIAASGSLITSTGTAPQWTTGSSFLTTNNVVSATYVPTLTSVTNVSASTLIDAWYSRNGNVVTVYFTINIDATVALTGTQLDISLPVASNFVAGSDVTGILYTNDTGDKTTGVAFANDTNDRTTVTFDSGAAAGNATYRGWFSYKVL